MRLTKLKAALVFDNISYIAHEPTERSASQKGKKYAFSHNLNEGETLAAEKTKGNIIVCRHVGDNFAADRREN